MNRAFQGLVFFLLLQTLAVTAPPGLDVVRAASASTLPPAAPVAAVYQPGSEQLHVFVIDGNGALNVVSKAQNGIWDAPLALTGADFVAPGASIAAAYYPAFQQVEAFVVDKHGVFNVIWKDRNGWHAPVGLTTPGFAPPGAPLAAVDQPINEQLEVFVVDAHGALTVVWKENNHPWKQPFAMTGVDFAKPGASVAGVYYPPYKQLEVFVVDKFGAFNVVWKKDNGAWQSPVGLSTQGFAPKGAPLAVVYQPLNEHLEVFVIDSNGAFNVIWKEYNQPWKTPFALTVDDWMTPGASLTSLYNPTNEQLEVYLIDKSGAFNVFWKEHDGPWKDPVGVTERHFVPGAPVAAAYYPHFDQIEAFSTDRDGVLYVEWKVRNQAWVPCSFPLMGTLPTHVVPRHVTAPTVIRTERIGQLTGSTDPEHLPILNDPNTGEWQGAGVQGTDLGANTDHKGKLHIFFGDVVPGSASGPAARDTDLVAWTTDAELRPGGFTLHPVKAGRSFDPFTVDAGIGVLPIGNTPTGAFSYEDRAYVFGLWTDPRDPVLPGTNGVRLPTTVLASKTDPDLPGPYRLEFTLSKAKFWQVAPVVVKNAAHSPGLPESEGDGLILLGGGHGDAVYLAWMRLVPGHGPMLSTLRYYTGNPGNAWTPAENDAIRALAHEPQAKAVINLPDHYTSVSAAWLADARQWIVLYSEAVNDSVAKKFRPAGPIIARFGTNPWSWSDGVQVFNTCRDLAYGHFMHWTGVDDINSRVPPDVFGDAPGWAYGAFVLKRFTHFDAASDELSLAYLMSTSTPYQVQVMRTQLRMPSLSRADRVRAMLAIGADFSVAEADMRQWLGNPATPYPAIADALLQLLNGKRLRQPVYLDVIVWNYEHAPGASSPRSVDEVDLRRLRAAVVEGYNTRYGEAVTDFQRLTR
jgi:hypothetical protein